MSLAETVAAPGVDLEALRQMLRGRAEGGIVTTLGFDLVELGDGRAVCAGVPGRNVYNPIGTVHGGYAAALLDSACGCAVHTRLAPDERYTTLELKVAYHRPLTEETGVVRAEGRVVTLGRRTAYAEARLEDAAGCLYATATSTLLVIRP